jgi:inner membrane protein
MMAKTHILLSITLTSFALETTHPFALGIAALASQLPDVDTSTSLVGRILFPLSRWLERRFPHRTVTHSFLATGIIALLALPLRWQQTQLWYAVILGYGSGWFGDAFTKSGVAAFYPLSSARLVIPANPRLRLATGSRAEYVVCVGLLLSLFVSVHLHTQGGLRSTFNAWLAQPEGVTTLFAKASATHQILAQIEGRFVASATPVNAEFTVLEIEGERLLVRAANSTLYGAEQEAACAHCHLAIHRVQARLGARIVIATHELRWQEAEVGEALRPFTEDTATRRHGDTAHETSDEVRDSPSPIPRVAASPSLRTVYVSGEIILRDADGLRLPTSLQHFNPVEVIGNLDEWSRYRTVRLRAATLADLAPLQRYFGSGHLIVKIIQVKR